MIITLESDLQEFLRADGAPSARPSIRTFNLMAREHIHTIGQLVDLTRQDVEGWRNHNEATFHEVAALQSALYDHVKHYETEQRVPTTPPDFSYLMALPTTLDEALLAVREAILDTPWVDRDDPAYALRAIAAVDQARRMAEDYVPRPAPPPTRARGLCSQCPGDYVLRSDGTLWAHVSRTGTRRCPGTHQPPRESA